MRLKTRKSSEIRYDFGLVAIFVLGAVLRILYLGRKSYWWDEVATIQICSVPFPEFLRWLWHREANMSFYYLLVRGLTHFGDSEVKIRLLSVAFAVVSIPLIYLVGVRAFGSRRVGLIAALLLSINTAHVAYAQEARSYALLMFLCLLSLFFFLRIPESEVGNGIPYIVFSVLAVYAHFFAVFFLVAQWSSLFWLQRYSPKWKEFLIPLLMTVILISPALYYMLFRRSGQLAYVPAIQFKDLSRLIFFLAADGGRFHRALALLFLLCCGVAMYRLLVRCRENPGLSQNWSTIVIICCAVIPVIVTFVLSFWMPMFAMHYLLICLPPVVLLAAQGLAGLPSAWFQVGVAVCIVLLSIGALRWYYAHPKDDWRGLTAYLIEHAEPGDAIMGCPEGVEWPVKYYVSRSAARAATQVSYTTPASLENDVNLHRSSNKSLTISRVWVVTWGTTCDARIFGHVAPEYERIDEQPFFGIAMALYANSGR